MNSINLENHANRRSKAFKVRKYEIGVKPLCCKAPSSEHHWQIVAIRNVFNDLF